MCLAPQACEPVSESSVQHTGLSWSFPLCSFELLDPEPKNLCEVCVLCYSADPCWLRLEITTTLSQHSFWAALGGRARNHRDLLTKVIKTLDHL